MKSTTFENLKKVLSLNFAPKITHYSKSLYFVQKYLQFTKSDPILDFWHEKFKKIQEIEKFEKLKIRRFEKLKIRKMKIWKIENSNY